MIRIFAPISRNTRRRRLKWKPIFLWRSDCAIAELQEQAAISQQSNWLEQITGACKDEPAFDEILAYRQAIRKGEEL